jgi:type IV pilus assembly protein PilQ
VKHIHGSKFLFSATTLVFLASQSVSAQTTQITNVQLQPSSNGVSLMLTTSSGDRAQVFTTKRGNALVADIINTQLRLSQGNSFRQDNPAPGIASVAINQLDSNSIRVTVTGSKGTPGSQPIIRGSNQITLGFDQGDGTVAASPTPTVPTPTVPNTQPPSGISQQPAPTDGPGQPSNVAPPFLPRAVAPPVGDIAISAIDVSPSVIDLGTQERVPRLVLRDAPVREVLSLLARAANMNLAYSSVDTTTSGGQGAAAVPGDGLKVSLDIQNEPVQDVFNYVLRLSGLEANRSGRTIFVGPKLPNSSRDVVMRNLRLNQVTVDVALNFLVGLGADSAVSRERQVTSVSAIPVGQGATPVTQSQTTTETKIERLTLEDSKYSSPLLRGLQALGDQRTNSITLIGTPKQIELAMAQLSQLDIRRRQVAVNVKIVDVNLTGIKDFNTSFSFGIGNNFFSSDGGNLSSNIGGSRPATGAETQSSVTGTPTTTNPLSNANIFLNQQNPNQGVASAGISSNPTQPGLSAFTEGTPGTVTSVPTAFNPVTGQPTSYTTQVTGQTPSKYTYSLPTLYQFPKRFLASVQAQIQNQNAKILTDPTLIVQEGQTANVNLTQQVVGNFKREITRGDGTSSETITVEKENVGLTLAVKVDRIDDNGFVSLSVAPNVKAPQASQNINTGSGSNQIFLVSERSLNSGLVRLRDGQTLILSGIIQDQDRTSVSKIPILGDIPLLGSLFRRTNRQNQRNEVIVLLTPQIMDDSEKSSYGYNYNPSPEVRQILERQNLKVPRK